MVGPRSDPFWILGHKSHKSNFDLREHWKSDKIWISSCLWKSVNLPVSPSIFNVTSMLLRTAIYLAALVLPRSARTAGTCFLPDGSKDKKDLPCFSNNTTSRCCAPDQFCSTNKLCVLNEGGPRYARGSCLDKTFGSTCPNFCKSSKLFPRRWTALIWV